MSETITAGASGTPQRIDLAQYRDAIKRAPELLQHLCHLVVPGRYVDGQPTATDLQAAPGRIAPLDAIDSVFVWLWREANAWQWATPLPVAPRGHMVRRDDKGRPIGPAGVVGTPEGGDQLHGWARELVAVLMQAWPTIETHLGDPKVWGQHEAHEWASSVDKALLRPLAQWPLTERAAVPSRPRECPACGERDVFADLDTTTGVCQSCRHVIAPEVWVTVREAARILDVAERTVRDWIAAGLTTRGTPRRVELSEARTEKTVREARRALNLPS